MTKDQGFVTVPARMVMTAAILPNILKRDEVEKKGITGYEVTVPSRILRLDIRLKPNFVLRAVMVFEHRNLNFMSHAIKSHVEDVLIVQVNGFATSLVSLLRIQTGGYSSLSIREFLNLLSTHRFMQHVPILFFSDHGVYGFDIYHVLKFGSRVTAWSSPTLVCPRLKWAGPTTDDLWSTVTSHAANSSVEKISRRR